MPSPGSSTAQFGATMIGRLRATSTRDRARRTLPCVICGNGRLETITATMVAGTASASSAAMPCAALVQVSERMPPAITIAGRAGHHQHRRQPLGLAEQPGRGVGGKACLRRQQQQDGHRQHAGRHHAHRAAVEAAAEEGRHGEGADLAEERHEQQRGEHQAGVPADAEAQRVEADDEEGAGQRQEAGAAERGDAERQSVEERRHAPPAREIVLRLARGGHHADAGVQHDRAGEHGQPHQRVGGAELLEHHGHQHDGRERRREDAEVGAKPRVDEPGARGERHH